VRKYLVLSVCSNCHFPMINWSSSAVLGEPLQLTAEMIGQSARLPCTNCGELVFWRVTTKKGNINKRRKKSVSAGGGGKEE
jgi:hypothetical protein